MKKKILLIVRRTSAEVDWVLPLLFRLNNKYKILTIFESQKVFDDLKRNKQLFQLWNSISKDFYIRHFYDDFLNRTFLYITDSLDKYFRINGNKFRKKIKKKIFINNILMSKFKLNNLDDIKFLFHDWGGFTGWLDAFENLKTKIVYFPHSALKYTKMPNHIKNLNGFLMIVGSKTEKKKCQNNFNGKTIDTGHFKYSHEWLKRFKPIKRNNKKIKIVLPMKDWIDSVEKEKLKHILESIFKILMKNSDKIILYIKSSRINYNKNNTFLNSFIKNYKFRYCYCKDSLISLAKSSDLFLVFNDSSVTYDALSQKTLAVELWNKNPKISTTKDYTFIVNNENEFEKFFFKIKDDSIKKDFEKKYKLFSKNFLSRINYQKVLKHF